MAAKIVMSADKYPASFNCENIGVTATLKPHQIDGVSWLIRRYRIGVNVILGKLFMLFPRIYSLNFIQFSILLKLEYMTIF